MRLSSTALFVCLLAATASAFERGTEKFNGVDAVAREVIVKFRPGRAAAAPQIAAEADAEHSEAVGSSNDLRLIRSRSKDVATLVKQLSQRADVEIAEPNYILRHEATPADASYPNMWSLNNTGMQYGGVAGADIEAQAAWDITKGSSSVAVGIIDTGADLSHPDLQANLWSAPSQFTVTVGGRTVTCPAGSRGFDAFTFGCYPQDDHGHGTHIAGTIGATGNNGIGVTGVNWTTKMVIIRTMNAANTGTAVEAINGIDFLIQANAYFARTATPLNVRVMSASWTIGGPSYTLYQAIQRAHAADVLFVAAAGNQGVNTDINKQYPAGYDLPNIIAVAASDVNDNKPSFSNYGPTSVDLGAPGWYILSTTLGGAYGLKHGTSMATPHVSGVAALTLSKCQLSNLQLKDAILRNVDLVPGFAGISVSGGRLNAYKTLRSCASATSSFSLSAATAQRSVTVGQSTSYPLTIVAENGFTGNVNLSVSGAPAGVTPSFSANPVYVAGTSSPALNVAAAANTAPGTYPLTVTATGNGITRTVQLTLTVGAAASFTLSSTTSSQSVLAGGSTAFALAIAPVNGFTNTVALSVSGAPAGVSATFSPASVAVANAATSSTLSIVTATSAPTGTYTLVVTASGGGVTRTANVTLNIGAAPTFSISATPSATVLAGQNASYQVTLTAVSGFASAVSLSVAGLPSGAITVFAANPMSLSSTISTGVTIGTSSATPAGTYYLTLTASGGGITRSAGITLIVSAPAVSAPAPVSNIPAAPVNISAVQMFATQTKVSWTASSSNHTGFQFEACQGSGCDFSTKIAANFPASMTYMTHNPVYPGQVWSYRVRAFNSYGASAWSPVATVVIR